MRKVERERKTLQAGSELTWGIGIRLGLSITLVGLLLACVEHR